MLTQPTMDKLRELRLKAMVQALEEQRSDPEMASLGFEERLGLLVDVEWLDQQNRRLTRRLREAKLRIPNACVEDIEYAPGRGLDRGLIRELTTCRWVEEHLNLLVTGATGVGKTYLADALTHQACRKGFRALSFRAPRLFRAATLARAEGTYPRFLAKLSRVHVLLIEDFALEPMVERDRYDLLEILEDRYDARSTIVSSQLPPDVWHERLGDPTVADAVLDRLVHNAYRIALTGPSRRKAQGRKP
jgi:DNA replication protein DnaC